MDAKELFRLRQSVRAYTDKQVTDEQLAIILDETQLSPMGLSKYDGIHLTVIRDAELLEKFNLAAREMYQKPNLTALYGAPCMIVVSGLMGDILPPQSVYANAAIVTEHIALSATNEGIGSCIIGGAIMAFNKNPEYVAELNLPEGFELCGGVILGEPVEPLAVKPAHAKQMSVSYID